MKRRHTSETYKAEILQCLRVLLNLHPPVRGIPASTSDLMKHTSLITAFLTFLVIMTAGTSDCHAQRKKKDKKTENVSVQKIRKGLQTDISQQEKAMQHPHGQSLAFFIEGEDTIYYDTITASKVYSRIPKQKGREWRQYYRLVHNFSKAYPYALVAKKLVAEADSIIAADRLKGVKREKYIAGVQKELFEVFEGQMRNLTVSQGALIMKLVDREIGKSSYNIIKDYKSGITAGFWQGVAKVFGSDLKKPYDPEGEDAATEELVTLWHNGDFPALYWSLFWKDPPTMPIPEKYL